jgi:hypothetical protein
MSLICAQCLHLEETIHINGSARELIVKCGRGHNPVWLFSEASECWDFIRKGVQ